jgi:hypothetical protein
MNFDIALQSTVAADSADLSGNSHHRMREGLAQIRLRDRKNPIVRADKAFGDAGGLLYLEGELPQFEFVSVGESTSCRAYPDVMFIDDSFDIAVIPGRDADVRAGEGLGRPRRHRRARAAPRFRQRTRYRFKAGARADHAGMVVSHAR